MKQLILAGHQLPTGLLTARFFNIEMPVFCEFCDTPLAFRHRSAERVLSSTRRTRLRIELEAFESCCLWR